MPLTTDDHVALEAAQLALHLDAQTAALTWNILWGAPIVHPMGCNRPLDPRAMTRSLALTHSVASDAFEIFA